MPSTVFINEKKSFQSISQQIIKNGIIPDRTVGLMTDGIDFETGKRTLSSAETHIYRTENGNDVVFSENSGTASITYVKDKETQVSICYDKISERIGYFLHSKKRGDKLLALISENSNEFPIAIYGNNFQEQSDVEKNIIVQDALIEELSPTVIGNLEESIKKDETIDSEEKNDVLNSFYSLLDIEKDRVIKPLSSNEIEEHLRMVIKKLSNSNLNTVQLQKENDELRKENAKIKSLLQTAQEMLDNTQGMLKKTFDFVTTVRDNFIGKVLFKKALSQFELEKNSLPPGNVKDER